MKCCKPSPPCEGLANPDDHTLLSTHGTLALVARCLAAVASPMAGCRVGDWGGLVRGRGGPGGRTAFAGAMRGGRTGGQAGRRGRNHRRRPAAGRASGGDRVVSRSAWPDSVFSASASCKICWSARRQPERACISRLQPDRRAAGSGHRAEAPEAARPTGRRRARKFNHRICEAVAQYFSGRRADHQPVDRRRPAQRRRRADRGRCRANADGLGRQAALDRGTAIPALGRFAQGTRAMHVQCPGLVAGGGCGGATGSAAAR